MQDTLIQSNLRTTIGCVTPDLIVIRRYRYAKVGRQASTDQSVVNLAKPKLGLGRD
jgi:hypothetical protein